jgi:isopenicillin N synthase-like dioxygenase
LEGSTTSLLFIRAVAYLEQIPRDGIFNLNPSVPFVRSPIVDKYCSLFQNFMSTLHLITREVVVALSNIMGLEGEDRLENCHGEDTPSGSVLSMYKLFMRSGTDDNVGHYAHTDVGSITLLFFKEWGLQVLAPRTNKWARVPPRPGYAIVNVGDALRLLSNFKLRSSFHRVVPHTGSSQCPRDSIVYFLRPDSDTIFKDMEGNEWTAQQWQERKYMTFRETHEKQKMSYMVSGEKGVLGLLDLTDEGVSA